MDALQTWTGNIYGHIHFSSKSDCISQGAALVLQTARVPGWDSYHWSQADAPEKAEWFIISQRSMCTELEKNHGLCSPLTHAHTDTELWLALSLCAKSDHSSFHVSNDTRAPPLSCQNLLACVFVNLKTEERERLRFKKKKSRKREAVLRLGYVASSHLIRRQWGEENKINDRSDHLSFVLFSLSHFRTLLVWGQMDLPHPPKMNIQTFIKPICIKGTGKNHVRYIQGYYIHIYALRVYFIATYTAF